MQIPHEFAGWKDSIGRRLSEVLRAEAPGYAAVHELGSDAAERLESFSTGGKMIRGGLVCLGSALFGGGDSKAAVGAGAAMELFQSALLIHDDIMDRDLHRRGEPSIHHQYSRMAEEIAVAESLHTGESLGICLGDIAFFLAFGILSALDVAATVRNTIIAKSTLELQHVGIAQMADVYRGAKNFTSADSPGEASKETLRVYLYKTGRYTFSLPLATGALLAGATQGQIDILEKLGEKLGVLFQIKDDEIGLFGSEDHIGKPVGSDIREGKKTIFYTETLAALEDSDARRLAGIFGNPEATAGDIAWVCEVTRTSGATGRVQRYIDEYGASAAELLSSLVGVDEQAKRVLVQLHEYNMNRNR